MYVCESFETTLLDIVITTSTKVDYTYWFQFAALGSKMCCTLEPY